jgi:arylsulfatase A-like enzyme
MKPNVILVLIDGARWDRIEKSKDFVETVQKGTLFDNVTTAIPYTIGSVNAIFSGNYGKENGINAYYKMFRLKKSMKIMPEFFKENGYFTACDLLSDKIIANRGFDIHQSHDEHNDNLFERHPKLIEKCLQEANNKPIFLFLHFTRIHTITVSEVLKKYEWDDKSFYNNKKNNLKDYDSVFLEAGKYTSKILDAIKKLNIDKNTILIFFSDHGTGIGERFGERNYGSFTFEETIRTFYTFIGPNIIGNRKTSRLSESIDILPTILDYCEINHEDLPGKSFFKFLINKKVKIHDKKYTFSETGALHGPYPSPMEPNVYCIKSSKYKLIFLKTPDKWELYDLENDPDELKNLYGTKLEIESKLKNNLLNWINRS